MLLTLNLIIRNNQFFVPRYKDFKNRKIEMRAKNHQAKTELRTANRL